MDKEDSTKKMVEAVNERRSDIPDQIDYSNYQFEREIIDNAFDAIYVHTLDGKLVEVNETACRRLGLNRRELVNKEREELLALALVGSMPEYIELIKRDGELTFESISLTESGELIPVEVRAKKISYKGEDVILTFSRDLTEQREKENAIRDRLETLQRHALNLSRLYSIENVAEYSFEIIEELLGMVKGAIGVVDGGYLKFVFLHNLSPENIPSLPLEGKGISIRAVRTGETQIVGNTNLDPDYVEAIDCPNRLSELDVPVKIDGKVVAVINLQVEEANAFTEDDRKIVEVLSEQISTAMARIELLKDVKKAEEKWHQLLESSPDSVIVLSGTTIQYVNRNTAILLGYSDSSELIGKDVALTLPSDEIDRIRVITLSRQRGDKQPSAYELNLLSKGGQIIRVETAVNTIEFEGNPAVVAFARDISQRKK